MKGVRESRFGSWTAAVAPAMLLLIPLLVAGCMGGGSTSTSATIGSGVTTTAGVATTGSSVSTSAPTTATTGIVITLPSTTSSSEVTTTT